LTSKTGDFATNESGVEGELARVVESEFLAKIFSCWDFGVADFAFQNFLAEAF
jgi:hypothetical protein